LTVRLSGLTVRLSGLTIRLDCQAIRLDYQANYAVKTIYLINIDYFFLQKNTEETIMCHFNWIVKKVRNKVL